jgi:hypothetical protein
MSEKRMNDIPQGAYNLHIFTIRETEDGLQAFVGYYLPNGDFAFTKIPYYIHFQDAVIRKSTIEDDGK